MVSFTVSKCEAVVFASVCCIEVFYWHKNKEWWSGVREKWNYFCNR